MLTLDQIPTEKYVKIKNVDGGTWVKQRLQNLGIHVGESIFVKRGTILGGPILVRINNSDVAIGRGMARKIVVSEPENEPKHK